MPFDPRDELVRPAPQAGSGFTPPEGDELVQPAQPERGAPGFAVDALRSVLGAGGQSRGQPSQPQSVPELVQGGRERVGAGREFFGEEMPRQAGEFTQDQARLSGIHYRLLGSQLGLPVDPPSEEELEDYERGVTDMLGIVGGAGAGGAIAKGAKGAARFMGRGMQTRAATKRHLADQAEHVVPPGSPRTTSRVKELALPAIGATASGAAVDFSNVPEAYGEFWNDLIAAGAGLATGGLLGDQARRNLLIQDPKFRAAVMKASRAGMPSKAIGALIGHFLTQAAQGSNQEDQQDREPNP